MHRKNPANTEEIRSTETRDQVDLGQRVKWLRSARDLTLRRVSERSGLSISMLSKIENGQLSPTYGKIFHLARGLGVDVADLFANTERPSPMARRSITRTGQGRIYETETRVYEMLCTDIVGKKITPFRATIKADVSHDLLQYMSHEGEEVIFVLSGKIELWTEFYEKTILEAGDCAYYDSTMGHMCTAHGLEDAEVFWVCSSNEMPIRTGNA